MTTGHCHKGGSEAGNGEPHTAGKPRGAKDSAKWAWVDSNHRPHAYQAPIK